jgi:arginyl-tRNA--protein-N-Asp/Glu arginylyltransferase
MFTEFQRPSDMPPNILDDYLAKGWYRMGQGVFTTHALILQEGIFPTIWIRLDLENYAFRKRSRKLMKRNSQQFRVELSKFRLSIDLERLYASYKSRLDGFVSENLRSSLLDGGTNNIYNTKMFRIYDGDKLVAASFFDLGKASMAGISAIFDLDYGRYSLGFFTMLLEIDHAQRLGLRWYYPGYVVHGHSGFDYKLRIGDVEYYDPAANTWGDFSGLDPKALPIEKMRRQLQTAQGILSEQGVAATFHSYAYFENGQYSFDGAEQSFLGTPFILTLERGRTEQEVLTLTFEPMRQTYKLSKQRIVRAENMWPFFNTDMPDAGGVGFPHLLIEYKILMKSDYVFPIVEYIKKRL